MKRGFYSRLGWSNIKKNKQIYLPYILTTVGMVMMFYMVSHLAMDSEVGEFKSGGSLQIILRLGMIVVGLFSFIFLNYTNSFLMKRRKTELGLYNVLGMGKVHIAKVLFWESFYVVVGSTVLGLICGIIFGKVAQLSLIRMLGGNVTYTFRINPIVFLYTIVLFAVIFFVIYLGSIRQLVKSSAKELLGSSSLGEKEPKANFVIAIIGLILLGAGYYIAIVTDDPFSAIMLFFVAVILVILGTYGCFIAGSVALLKILRKNKKYYYKTNHFVSTSSMVFRMKRNGAGLASICILSTMVLVMLSSTACMYFGLGDSVNDAFKRDIETEIRFTGTNAQTFNNAAAGLDAIVDDCNSKKGVTAENFIRYRNCEFYAEKKGEQFNFSSGQYADEKINFFEMIPLDDYNLSSGENKVLADNEVLIYDPKSRIKGDTINLEDETQYKVTERLDTIPLTATSGMMDDYRTYIVVSDVEEVLRIYGQIDQKQKENSDFAFYYKMVYTLGYNTDVDDDEQIALKDDIYFGLTDPNTLFSQEGEAVRPVYESMYTNVISQAEVRQQNIGLYGGMFFLGIILSLTFILATVLIMYYKQVTEGYDDKGRFAILQKVGMSDREIKKSINSQVLTVFFTPLIGAGLHIGFAFSMIALMLKAFGIFNTLLLAKMTLIAFLIFAVFYVIVYLATSKVYYKLVSGDK